MLGAGGEGQKGASAAAAADTTVLRGNRPRSAVAPRQKWDLLRPPRARRHGSEREGASERERPPLTVDGGGGGWDGNGMRAARSTA